MQRQFAISCVRHPRYGLIPAQARCPSVWEYGESMFGVGYSCGLHPIRMQHESFSEERKRGAVSAEPIPSVPRKYWG